MQARKAGRNSPLRIEPRPEAERPGGTVATSRSNGPVRIEPRREGGWRLSCRQWLPGRPADVFPFFGSARNLERITPPFLRFRIRGVRGEPLEAGSLIDYGLRLHRLPIRWRTLIEIWDPPRRFVDRQVRGPFREWRHRHTFEAGGDRTLVTDVVDFDLYCRMLARTPLLAWVDADLKIIFEYRRRATATAFDPGREFAPSTAQAPGGDVPSTSSMA